MDLFHRLVRLDRLIEERFSFAPGPPRCPRHPSCIPPAPLGLGHLGIGLTRRLELTLCSLLYPPQGPLQLPLGVKDVEAHRDRHWRDALGLLRQGRAGFIGQLHPPLKPRAPIGNDVLQARPMLHHLAPTLPAAIRAPLPRHPHQAIRFDPHQNGLAMKEDFVETQHEDSRLTGPVEDLQDTARLSRGLLHPAPYCGSTGHDSPGQHDGEHRHDLRQAHPHRTA